MCGWSDYVTLTADMVSVCFCHQRLFCCLAGLLPQGLLASLGLVLKALDGVAGLFHQGLLHVSYELHNCKFG